jgi:hypothetical protein
MAIPPVMEATNPTGPGSLCVGNTIIALFLMRVGRDELRGMTLALESRHCMSIKNILTLFSCDTHCFFAQFQVFCASL